MAKKFLKIFLFSAILMCFLYVPTNGIFKTLPIATAQTVSGESMNSSIKYTVKSQDAPITEKEKTQGQDLWNSYKSGRSITSFSTQEQGVFNKYLTQVRGVPNGGSLSNTFDEEYDSLGKLWKLGAKEVMSGLLGTVLKVITYINEFAIIPLFSTILGISGTVLDYSIKFSLENTAIFIKSIDPVWSFIRDFFNITFIFAILYIAITTIVGMAGKKIKDALAGIVMAAILVNFSAFITKIAIDAGNIVSQSIANTIIVKQNTQGDKISAKVMDSIKLSLLYKTKDAESSSAGTTDAALKSGIKLILNVTTSIAFFFGAFLIIGRLIILSILVMLSPIGFMGDVLPFMKEHSDKWRATLSGQVMVLPVFLIFIYAIGILTDYLGKVTKDDTVGTLFYFNYLVVVGLLIVAVKTTKKLGGEFGGMFSKIASGVAGFALGAVTGGTAMLGRATIGRAAAGLASSEYLKKQAASGGLLARNAARMTLKTGDWASKKSFDFRETKAGKGINDFSKKQLGVSISDNFKSGKDGYSGMETRASEARQKTAKLLERDMSEEEAIKEHNDLQQESRSKMASIRNEMRQQDNIAATSADEAERRKAEARATYLQEEYARIEAQVLTRENLAKKDNNGNISEEGRKAIRKERRATAQERFVQDVEGSVINRAMYRPKARKKIADDIRKKVIQGKSGAEKLQEAVEQAAKEQAEKAKQGGQATGNPTTGTTQNPPAAPSNPRP